MPMGSAVTPRPAARRRTLWRFVRSRSAPLALAACLLLPAADHGFAAGLLGGSHTGALPGLAPLPMPGTGSLPAPGSTPDTGTILGPSLSIPLSTPSVGPLNDPLAAVPNIGSDLPLGVSPELKDLSKNVQNLQPAGNAGRPIRRGFVLPAAGERRFVADEVVLDIPNIPAPTLDAIAKRHRLTLIGSRGLALTGHTLYRWRIEDGRPVADVIRALAGEQRLSAAQPNFTFTLQQQQTELSPTEGDPAQYAVAKLRLAEAHRLAKGDNVLVALIDSGVDLSHPELAGVVAASYDAISGDAQPHPHGTAMAGAIAAHEKLIGVAPRVRLLAIRAFGPGPEQEGTTFRILSGLDWAVEHGARVVNMSFAGPADPALKEALAKARKKGLVLIAAAGNAGPKSPPLYPAADPNVIAVTATDVSDHLFAGANRGSYIALAAPGVDILTPAPHAAMQLSTGTSVAAAHVSGIAALLIERKPSLRPDEVRKILTSSARHMGSKARDNEYGAGIADALDAVSALQPKSAQR
jgi:subtilisin family serine protease